MDKGDMKRMMDAAVSLAVAIDKIERLRDALEFYALSFNWDLMAPGTEQSPVGLDGGEHARRALQH